ncbi:LysR family transcriptional regulator [Stappia sp. P2PMeth1]|uniref:LysR family transcriptional regulator n=1 Tax=Stappia sp. P2PMeth1 TaxID=2003586 RepID=UPI001648CC38|nr:LysR family transcriptional regulator [Stappia sp. P2PMeth1]
MLAPEVILLLRLADLGTLAAVAEETGMTPSGVSRMVSRLEKRTGIKLVHRSTRRLAFTPEGAVFIGYARRMLALAQAAEVDLSHRHGEVRGHLRVNCGTAFARHRLAPLLPAFLRRHPAVTVGVSVSDHRIDPFEEQIDVTIRVGLLDDSELIAARLGTVRRVIAASPAYLERRGTPTTAQDLASHDCLLLTGFPGQAYWPMIEQGAVVRTPVRGSVTADSADTLLQMAIEGVGIIRLGDFLGRKALAEGQLVELFQGQHDADPKPISALMLPGRQAIPRVRAFVDFLKERA